jgi:hypothetical protein
MNNNKNKIKFHVMNGEEKLTLDINAYTKQDFFNQIKQNTFKIDKTTNIYKIEDVFAEVYVFSPFAISCVILNLVFYSLSFINDFFVFDITISFFVSLASYLLINKLNSQYHNSANLFNDSFLLHTDEK